MKYELRRLKDETDIGKVVDYCGINTYPRGSAIFIHCPNPNHADEHATNAYFKDGWNSIYCSACGCSTGGVDLLMNQLGLSFKEATNTLWEINGCPDWYKTEESKTKHLYLTKEELDLADIHLPGRIFLAKNAEDDKPEKHYRMAKKWEVDPFDLTDPFTFTPHNCYIRGYVDYAVKEDFLSEEEFASLVYRKVREREEFFGKALKEKLIAVLDVENETGADATEWYEHFAKEYVNQLGTLACIKEKINNFL